MLTFDMSTLFIDLTPAPKLVGPTLTPLAAKRAIAKAGGQPVTIGGWTYAAQSDGAPAAFTTPAMDDADPWFVSGNWSSPITRANFWVQ